MASFASSATMGGARKHAWTNSIVFHLVFPVYLTYYPASPSVNEYTYYGNTNTYKARLEFPKLYYVLCILW